MLYPQHGTLDASWVDKRFFSDFFRVAILDSISLKSQTNIFGEGMHATVFTKLVKVPKSLQILLP